MAAGFKCKETPTKRSSYRALIRYSARLMLAWEPVMVTCLSVEPSTGLAILIWAPDIWRISLIFAPWRPMMQPMSWGRKRNCSYQGRQGKKIKSGRRCNLLHDLHRLEWSARESQSAQRHPSQLRGSRETTVSVLMIANLSDTSYLPTYPGSPGCYVQLGKGSAAWPAGEVWWAVEMWKENTQTILMKGEKRYPSGILQLFPL